MIEGPMIWKAVIISAHCFLCRSGTGAEWDIPVPGKYRTEIQCKDDAARLAELARVPSPYRIECKVER